MRLVAILGMLGKGRIDGRRKHNGSLLPEAHLSSEELESGMAQHEPETTVSCIR